MASAIAVIWAIGLTLFVLGKIIGWFVRQFRAMDIRAADTIASARAQERIPGEPPPTWCPRHWPHKCPDGDNCKRRRNL